MADAIVPVDQAEVTFHEDHVAVALVEENGEERIYVAMPALCRNLGLDWAHQRRRIAEDPILSEAVKGVRLDTAPSEDGRGGGAQTVTCLPLEFAHGWLFKVSINRAKPEVREALVRYQREVYAVLARAFNRKSLEQRRALEQVERIAMATAELARRQIEQGGDIDRAHTRIDRAGIFVRDLAIEVAELRERLGLGRPITSEQAEAVRQRVDNVAGLLGGVPGYGGRRKPHAAVWSELKRLFGVPSYRELTVGQYGAVAAFLDKWAGEISEALEAGGEDGRQDA